jgi:hypothetical protein
MRLIYIACILFFNAILGSSFVIWQHKDPQQLLVGTWQEVGWEYEKLDKSGSLMSGLQTMQFSEICPDMMIHQAEYWRFDKDRTLRLQQGNEEKEMLRWNIKGMGNILELKHGDQKIESYKVKEISEDSLVIHFSFDLQVRGIVKMTFKKVKEEVYAQKI